MNAPPTFSIIVTDYDKSIPRDRFRRKMRCLAAQTSPDFEVLVYHDGPKSIPYADEVADLDLHPATQFIVTDARANDWGHSNRDRGIRAARGRWIIHTNADNVLYPTLIERLRAEVVDAPPEMQMVAPRYPILIKSLAKRSDRLFGTAFTKRQPSMMTEKEIIIYAVLMRGMVPNGSGYRREREFEHTKALVFGGVPVQPGLIDAMQLVMRRDLWLGYGGWYDRSEDGDGIMYERFARHHAVSVVPEVLGEHW